MGWVRFVCWQATTLGWGASAFVACASVDAGPGGSAIDGGGRVPADPTVQDASASEAASPGTTCPDGTRSSLAIEPDAGCPASLPTGGSCCATPGLTCSYPADEDSHLLAACAAQCVYAPAWQVAFVADRITCRSPDDAGTSLGDDGGIACEARPLEPCNPTGIQNPQSLWNLQLLGHANLCGGIPEEEAMEVHYEDGCATSVVVRWPNSQSFVECLAPLLSGVQWACAVGLSCAEAAGPSTIL